jgi:hypothetical protein
VLAFLRHFELVVKSLEKWDYCPGLTWERRRESLLTGARASRFSNRRRSWTVSAVARSVHNWKMVSMRYEGVENQLIDRNVP